MCMYFYVNGVRYNNKATESHIEGISHKTISGKADSGAREQAHGYHCFKKQQRPCPSGLVSLRKLAEGAEGVPAAPYSSVCRCLSASPLSNPNNEVCKEDNMYQIVCDY